MNGHSYYGTGKTTAQATAIWNGLTPARRARFTRDTGYGLTEFIDMLAFVPSGRARTENEALNAFGSQAAKRTLATSSTMRRRGPMPTARASG